VIALAIYAGLSVQNCIQICSDLTFLLYNVQGFTFLLDTVCHGKVIEVRPCVITLLQIFDKDLSERILKIV